MRLISKKENQIIFSAEIEEGLANAIRRSMNQVQVLAVEEVEISKNDSPLYDETVAHRIGLIPLKTKKVVNEKSTGELKLDTKKEGMVYSDELKGDVEVVYDKIPITTLNKSQELKIIAKVKSGKGVEHAKFSPGLMFYRNIVDIKVNKDCPKEVVDICPKKVFEVKDGNVVVKDSSNCDMCDVCIETCRKQKKESVVITPTKELVLTLESFGQFSVEDIFSKSVEILKEDLAEVSNKIK